MGGSNYSDATFSLKSSVRTSSVTGGFDYSAKVKSSGILKTHDKLNPFKVVRESRDSTAHPNSLAISVLLDVTGSMKDTPRNVIAKLGGLMNILLQKNYVQDPQILFGAIGDAYTDGCPLQIGQFESGNEMEDCLTNLVLEGGGGGQMTESYELAMYFMAHKTSIDCFEKRGKKGYLFIVGDELFYKKLDKKILERVLGETVQGDIDIKDIVSAVTEKYHVFYLIPSTSYHYADSAVSDGWKAILGENVYKIENVDDITNYIASVIGNMEGILLSQIENDLVEAGVNKDKAVSIVKQIAKTGNIKKANKAKATKQLSPSGGRKAILEKV